jgi:hypothetical protein
MMMMLLDEEEAKNFLIFSLPELKKFFTKMSQEKKTPCLLFNIQQALESLKIQQVKPMAVAAAAEERESTIC